MTTADIFTALGGIAGILGGLTAFARYVADKATEAGAKRFESSLRQSEANHQSTLRRIEAEYTARLQRIEEEHKASVQYASSLDLDLRKSRTASYADLWTKTKKVSKWPKNEKLTYEALLKVSEELRDWYFDGGGILLSRSAQTGYRNAQTSITKVISTGATGKLDPKDYDLARNFLSALRSEMTDDLLSRREAPDLAARSAA